MNTSPARPLMGNADHLPMRGGNSSVDCYSPRRLFIQPAHDPFGECADVFQRGSPPAAGGEAGPVFLRFPAPLPFLKVDDVLHWVSSSSLASNCETRGNEYAKQAKRIGQA